MQKTYRIILLNLALCCICFGSGLFIASHAHAQSSIPGLPFQLYGKVTTSDGLPIVDLEIEARINGVVVAKSSTDAQGDYGIAPHLLIISDPEGDFSGKSISLSVNNVEVRQNAVFEPGALEKVNLITDSVSMTPSIRTPTVEPSENLSQPLPANPKGASSLSFVSTTTATTAPVMYTTPVFHLKKYKNRPAYRRHHGLSYWHSGILGTISFALVVGILSWVYLQNYLHYRKQGF